MIEISFEAIGTVWWIKIDNKALSDSIIEEIRKIVNDFEESYSRFKDYSLIGQLNSNKVLKNFPEELFDILIKSKQIYDITQGKFNIAIAHHLESIGYDKDYSFNISDPVKVLSWNDSFTTFNENEIEINKNVKIDLGGIGKGWLVDKVSNFLKSNGVTRFIINAGGDIYSEGKNKFYLENPLNEKESIGQIEIENASLASSSSSRRKWNIKNKEYSHIYNQNKNFIASYTYSKSCLNADVAATCLLLASSKEEVDKIAKLLEVEYLVVLKDKTYFKSKAYPAKLNF